MKDDKVIDLNKKKKEKEERKEKEARKRAIKRLIDYAKSLDW